MKRKGFIYKQGYKIIVKGDLPIAKGVSSSSALCVGWIALLSCIAENNRSLTKRKIAEYAFESEVLTFDEPGGMQDHIASAFGGMQTMDFSKGKDNPAISELTIPPDGFLLVDSGTIKNTIDMIQSIRNDVENALKKLSQHMDYSNDIQKLKLNQIPPELYHATQFNRLIGTLINRNLTNAFIKKYRNLPPKEQKEIIGNFMNTHQNVLKKLIRSSSNQIDHLCKVAIECGASGAKVIGSGGGGCILIYAPEHQEKVIRELQNEGASSKRIAITSGVEIKKVSTYDVI